MKRAPYFAARQRFVGGQGLFACGLEVAGDDGVNLRIVKHGAGNEMFQQFA